MARHLVHSLVLTAVLSPLVNAGPCRPSSSSTLAATVATTTKESTSFESLSTLLTSTITESETTVSATSLEATTTTTSCSTQPFPWELSSSVTTTTSEEPVATTTTTEAAATTTAVAEQFECENNLKVPAPANAACGVSGYRPSIPQGAKAIGSGSAESLSACYQSCMEKANCVTFAFQENSFCDLWKGAVGETDGAETGFKWYETRCFCDTGIEPAPTCEDTNIIKNAGWDTGKFSPWQYYPVAEDREIVDFSIKAGGADGTGYRFQTGNFHYDKSMWLYQDLTACPGVTLQCSFKWMWDKYYGIAQNNGDTLVPYVRIYQDNASRATVSEYPRSSADTQRWIESDSFYFTIPSSGKTRIWYVASSPQGEWINTSTEPYKSNWVHRTNKLALDSLICYPL
ncbi:unnamed protein product [Fusarium graminearum]|uniref:Uncharacterized protein n=1 Tax=Gibberella zeae TaxID=5518 RepID=A0A4E9DT98_GIBZA|nr:unnamed protein product [Fusarium graminearum]CAG1964972.1 unnamed protein product [Fusarium graminearum]CAG1999111.1 unnamed protein product [Fusarium graminearum]CAG2016709.1 unnamed protein product [Fusarium graminearum]